MIVDDKGTNDPFVEISYLKYKKSSVKKSDMVNSVKINFNFLTLLIFQVFNEHIVFEDVSFDINPVNIGYCQVYPHELQTLGFFSAKRANKPKGKKQIATIICQV